MTHEPECPTGKDWYEMCECEILRSAYERGREDAVQSFWMVLLGRYKDLVNSALHEAVSAAALRDGADHA